MKRPVTILSFAVFLLLIAPTQAQDVHWRHVNDDESISVDIDGDVTFTDDDMAVASLSRGGELRIRYETRRHDERLDVERDGDRIAYDYRLNGDRIAFEEAREEIGALLLRVIREFGINADQRVARLLREGGPDAVFQEVSVIKSGSSSRRYLAELASQATLSTEHLRRYAGYAVKEVPSSGDRARLLIAASEQFIRDQQAFPAWTDAVRSIASSGDRSRVLLRALEADLESDSVARLLKVAESIPSSGDRARVLIAATAQFRNEADVRSAFFAAAGTIPSSGDRSRVLLAVLRKADLDSASMVALLGAAATISSSGDKARVLVAASSHVEGEAEEEAYLDAAESISSSGDRGRALAALMRGS